ncbi:helix-turn-helix domain-containing protein [Streptomyces ochraceiscleroticus]|uniref:Helix-turn-helix domain-containing protein n=1 Tax=Streptomyces ochraceiscleroticus TaxID=47761 RepID=A0ABW1MM41_9ACTN|nr:helix-turn-helix transcriptional regulator [Streptomyces ochraceiscleroticus]
MVRYDAIDALVAGARQEAELPPADRRRQLREALGLSRAQVARALGVGPSTVGGWENGRDPSGEVRDKYAYFLNSAREKLATLEATSPGSPQAEDDQPAASASSGPEPGPDDAEVEILHAARPCVLCGQPARHQVAGFPQHLDPAACTAAAAASARAPEPARAPEAERGQVRLRPGRQVQAGPEPDLIGDAVATALSQHGGDTEAATAALIKRAIPDAMHLLDVARKGGRYDVVAHPWLPDILRKPSARGSDQIWEARPKWARPALPAGLHQVTNLDINGAYLSALKTHLPIGQLEHSTGDVHDRRRAGVHLITPPVWEHEDVLPNPLGSREEPGPLWVTEPTLRLLLRLSGPKYQLCDRPQIIESFTSGATENLLEKFRLTLKEARDQALAEEDEVTLEYVKAMYAKFVSTMGESNYNRELYRPDWMHLIRSQAFANLWLKAHKAHEAGLEVVSVQGTDELHVIGDWRRVFTEGRAVTEVKVKDVYSLGQASADPAAAGDASD